MAPVGRIIVGDVLALLANVVVAALPLVAIGTIWNHAVGIELIVIGLAIGAFGAIPTALCFIACRALKTVRDHKYWVQSLLGVFAAGYWYWQMHTSDSEGAATLAAFLIATVVGALAGEYLVYRRFTAEPTGESR